MATLRKKAQNNRAANSALLAGYAAQPSLIPNPRGNLTGAAAQRARNSALLVGYGAGARPTAQRPATPAPGVGTPPGQPQAPGAAAQFTPDAEYLAAAAQRQFDRTQAIQALTTQATNDQGDTAEAIRRLLQGAPEQRQGIKQNANKAGLFYSGQLGKQLNEYEGNLTRAQGDIQLDYDRREQARVAARSAIEQGMPLEEAAAMAESATRQVGRDEDAALSNSLVPTPIPTAAAPAAKKPAAKKPAVTKPKKYRWPDGKLHSRPYRGR